MFGVMRGGGVEESLTVFDIFPHNPRRVPQFTEAGVAVNNLDASAGVGKTSSEHLQQFV